MMGTLNWIPILAGALVVQLGLVGVTSLTGGDHGAFQAQEPLLGFDPAEVDQIRIAADEDTEVVLEREGAEWRLPALHDAPADGDAVGLLLERLAGLRTGWPVATTASAAKRFEVADDAFERRIELSADGSEVAKLFVGTSPGFRKVHARAQDSDEIHAVEFNAFDAGAEPADWLDRELLALDPTQLARVEIGEIALVRQDDAWILVGLEPGEQTVAAEADALVNRVARLRIETVLGKEDRPEYHQDAPALRIAVARKEGEARTYVFSQQDDEADYVLKVSDEPYYVRVLASTVKALRDVDRASLVEPETAPESAEEPDPAPQDGADATGDAEATRAQPAEEAPAEKP